MAIKPGLGRKSSSKNPPILSHDFVIQNHADIVSCVAMVFVVGLMLQATSSIASIFISLHHNVSGVEPNPDNHRGEPFFYESGIKDYCAIFFYTLICIIMHAILQEYLLDKISKKLHLSKFKLSRFNESGQLVVFYAMSFLWGLDVVIREGYFAKLSLLWDDFPKHPMGFLHKLYFIVQLSYYLHMLPELYFQKIKTEDQQPKIIHAICGFSIIALAYFLGFQRIALVVLTLHYCSEFVANIFQLIDVFDKEEKYVRLQLINNAIFILTRFAIVVIAVLTLYYGIGTTDHATRGIIALAGITVLQGYLIFSFITDHLKAKRERLKEAKQQAHAKKVKQPKPEKTKRKKESDLPEADQPPSPSQHGKQKVK